MSDIKRWEEQLIEAGFKKFDLAKRGPLKFTARLLPSDQATPEEHPLPKALPKEFVYPFFLWVDAPADQSEFRMTFVYLTEENGPWVLRGNLKDLREAPFGFHLEDFTLPSLQ